MRKFLSISTILIIFTLLLFGAIKLIAESGDFWTGGYDRSNSVSDWRINSSHHLIPGKDDTYNIGDATHEVQNIFIDGTATIDTLTVDGAATVGTTLTVAGTLATTGALDINGALNMNYVAAADSTTLTASSATVVNCTKAGTGAQEITLPTAVGNVGLYFIIKKSGATGIVTISTNSTETIDGTDNNVEVDATKDFLGIVSDGANWIVVNRYIQ